MSPLIATHTILATTALFSGAVALWARRSNTVRPAWHRAAGYAFIVSMLATAATACFIRDHRILNWHGITLIHLLIPLTTFGIARALWLVKNQRIAEHRKTMQSVYVGGCIIAGLFTLLPNRIIGRWLWSALGVI